MRIMVRRRSRVRPPTSALFAAGPEPSRVEESHRQSAAKQMVRSPRSRRPAARRAASAGPPAKSPYSRPPPPPNQGQIDELHGIGGQICVGL